MKCINNISDYCTWVYNDMQTAGVWRGLPTPNCVVAAVRDSSFLTVRHYLLRKGKWGDVFVVLEIFEYKKKNGFLLFRNVRGHLKKLMREWKFNCVVRVVNDVEKCLSNGAFIWEIKAGYGGTPYIIIFFFLRRGKSF